MKVFSSTEIKKLEQAAEASGVPMEGLMRSAGEALARHAAEMLKDKKPVVVLCGCGNNGGDGFICAAKLKAAGYPVTVLLLCGGPKTELAKRAYDKMPKAVKRCNAEENLEEATRLLGYAALVIDAVFGLGFRGALKGFSLLLIRLANQLDCIRLAADLPSGVQCDTGGVDGEAFQADKTVTFTALKPALVSYPAKAFCGEVAISDVGIPAELKRQAKSRMFLPDEAYVKRHLPAFPPDSHKGDRGRLLMVCGSYGMAGACIMAARAALRTGIGLLDIAVDRHVYPIIAAAVPEAVFTLLDGQKENALLEALAGADAVLAGCGLGKTGERLVPLLLCESKIPLVLDADALNAVASSGEELSGYPHVGLVTPHPGEMARLSGLTILKIQSERIRTARAYAKKSKAVTLLKGAATVIAAPDGQTAVNPTGNEGMAKGGSGDVLSGITGTLMAQGVSSFEAAVSAAYLHGMAGDLCAARFTKRAMLSGDLPDMLPEVFRQLETG